MAFVATCIETTARYLGTDYKDVFQRMEKLDMIDNYIIPNYEPLHSESREWLEFIVANRQGLNKAENYDYVEGGVANDRVVDTVNLYIAGLLEMETALREL